MRAPATTSDRRRCRALVDEHLSRPSRPERASLGVAHARALAALAAAGSGGFGAPGRARRPVRVTTTAEAQSAAAPTLVRPFSVRAALAAWPFQDVVLPFAVTRVLLVLAGFFALYTLPAAPNGDPWQASPHALVNAWASWDSRWYLQIAEQGYTLTPRRRRSATRGVLADAPRVDQAGWPGSAPDRPGVAGADRHRARQSSLDRRRLLPRPTGSRGRRK